MEELLTTKNIIIYFLLINILGFLLMYTDKQKAKRGSWRIQEKTLFVITALRWWNRCNCRYVYV